MGCRGTCEGPFGQDEAATRRGEHLGGQSGGVGGLRWREVDDDWTVEKIFIFRLLPQSFSVLSQRKDNAP